jgi:hypothetical protein
MTCTTMKAIRLLPHLLLALVCIGTLTGCKGPKIYIDKTAKGFFERTRPEDVEVLQAAPDRPVFQLASMYATRYKVKHIFRLEADLKKEAAVLGANAVVINRQGQEGSRAWAAAAAVRYK